MILIAIVSDLHTVHEHPRKTILQEFLNPTHRFWVAAVITHAVP